MHVHAEKASCNCFCLVVTKQTGCYQSKRNATFRKAFPRHEGEGESDNEHRGRCGALDPVRVTSTDQNAMANRGGARPKKNDFRNARAACPQWL